ncbi:Non-structural maintenance of chromosomes element 1-like protein, partial [Ophiophagus hannah]
MSGERVSAEVTFGPLFLQLDLILMSRNGFASSTEILNLADQLKPKKMKKMEVEQVLQQLVQKKWLCEKEGEYTLHIRSILELEQYIFRHYPESARKCHICHSLSVQVTTSPSYGRCKTWITCKKKSVIV